MSFLDGINSGKCQYCSSPATHEVDMGGYTQNLCERHYWKGIEMEREAAMEDYE